MATIYQTATKQTLTVASKPLAAGGEGEVYRITSPTIYQNACVKIFHPRLRTEQRRQKIHYMIQHPPQELNGNKYQICWPQELLYQQTQFVGFIMPLAFANSVQIYELCQPRSLRLSAPWRQKFDRANKTGSGVWNRLLLCVNLAIAIHKIHSLGNYTLVDMKPQNMLVTEDGKVSIIDLDSIQIAQNGMVTHKGQVATPEYIPPEGRNLDPAKDYIPITWDRFSLAVIFYEIIFGIHPYTATSLGKYQQCGTIYEKISNGLFVHGSKVEMYIQQPLPTPHRNFIRLPHSLRMLFMKAFEAGHENPKARPTAEDWGTEIYKEVKKSETTLTIKIGHSTPTAPLTFTSQPSEISYFSQFQKWWQSLWNRR
jgi:DNA-binding helix-hairpin-helix protein with protein kinase domain